MTLVHVTDAGVDSQRLQGPDSADSQQHLLPDPHFAVAAVQNRGDFAVVRFVAFEVGVEQEKGDAADVGAPYPGGYGAVRVGDLDGQGGPRGVGDRLDRKAVEVVLGIGLELPAVRVERLPEVPLAIQETDPGQGEAEVARRLQVVPGEHPEAPRIDRQGSGDSEFQREIGDLQTVLTVPLVEPGLSRHVLLERGGQPGDAGGELAVCLGRGQAVLAQRG